MKKLIFICCIFLFSGCIFTYDPAIGELTIRNNSDEAVYVYQKCGKVNVLPSEPKLELFQLISLDTKDPNRDMLISPEYRINAYAYGAIDIGGTKRKPQLNCEEKVVTLFFISEQTMRNYSWEEISSKQMFIKKIILTEEELKNNDWEYLYTPSYYFCKI